MDALRGTFIVFDGGDGAGKSTVSRAVAQRLRAAGLDVTECKDPGGTEIGDRIRSVLLDFDLTQMAVACETLLFMASRAQLVTEVVRPALAEGRVVLCDRYVSSTCAYQGAAEGNVDAIIHLAEYAIGTTWPDLTLILDVAPEIGFTRIEQRAQTNNRTSSDSDSVPNRSPGTGKRSHLDAMEQRPVSFHEKVRENFLALPARYPAPVEVFDAARPVEAIVDAVVERLERLGRRPS